jgi:hypothetical protein
LAFGGFLRRSSSLSLSHFACRLGLGLFFGRLAFGSFLRRSSSLSHSHLRNGRRARRRSVRHSSRTLLDGSLRDRSRCKGSLKDLEAENTRLKKLVADLSLDKMILVEASKVHF